MGKPERTLHIPSPFKIFMFSLGFMAGMFYHDLVFDLVKTFSGSGITSLQGTFTSAKDFATTNPAGTIVGLIISLGVIMAIKKLLIFVIGFIIGFFIKLFLQSQGIAMPSFTSLLKLPRRLLP